MTSRRSFLASLGLAPLVARSYFDLGPSWAKHESGIITPKHIGVTISAHGDQWDVWLLPHDFQMSNPHTLTHLSGPLPRSGQTVELLPAIPGVSYRVMA